VIFAAPFIPNSDDLRPFAAEICLLLGIAGNLLIPFVTRRPNLPCAMVTLLVLFIGAGALLGGASGASVAVQHLRGMLLFDSSALVAKVTLLFFVAGVVLLWIGHSGRTLREGDAPEFFTLLLGSTLGMCLMTSTTNLLMIVLAIAIASLPSYLLAGFRKKSRQAAEASLKYVLFGAVTGAIMIYGISFIYGVYGTLQMADLAARPAVVGTSAALSLAMIGLLIGVGFKISAVPFHFWCPDVFQGATIEVTTLLSVASKGAALILLLRIVQCIGNVHAGMVVGLIGVVTATVGNTAAFTQSNIKRLLAYSSIAQAGYMMCLVSAAGNAGESAGGPVTQALLLYLIIYAVMNLGAFAVAAVVIRQSGEDLENFAGLGRSSPLLAGAFFCCLISLIGLPPFAGFGAKVNILWVLAHGGGFGFFMVVAIVLNTLLSAFYYFRVIRVMYLERSNDRSRTRSAWSIDPLATLIAAVCAAALVAMFFAFQWLYTFTGRPPASAVNRVAIAWVKIK
jgi:NADH-quinone oxidoreductase subunit N